MPGWHAATKELQDEGTIQMVGIVEEQHGDRAGLFMQWKGMDWPILVDSLNLLEVPYVPITLFVDEAGTVRNLVSSPRKSAEQLASFLAAAPPVPVEPSVVDDPNVSEGDSEPIRRDQRHRVRIEPARANSAAAWLQFADWTALMAAPGNLGKVIAAYERAAELDVQCHQARFRLGVIHRLRFDSDHLEPGDFQRAVGHWETALEIAPNQYITRRRLEQYGPRLAKPYPFYDWVAAARESIIARCETPFPVAIEPSGAELAEPLEAFVATVETEGEPDPGGAVARTTGRIAVETLTVPSIIEPGGVARVHIVLRLRRHAGAHWNNEAGDLLYWVDPPKGWAVDRRLWSYSPLTGGAISSEPRRLEFEAKCPAGTAPGEVSFRCYALVHLCEDQSGACLYRRQDVSVTAIVENRTTDKKSKNQ